VQLSPSLCARLCFGKPSSLPGTAPLPMAEPSAGDAAMGEAVAGICPMVQEVSGGARAWGSAAASQETSAMPTDHRCW